MTKPTYAEIARSRKLSDAAAMGIDEAMISQLVEQFYLDIKAHGLLGPIFAERISNWPPHLARMKDFWASIAIESGRFHGNPMVKHIAIPGLTPAHFQAWLILWSAAVEKIVSRPAAAAFFNNCAHRIAESLQTRIAVHSGGLAALKPNPAISISA